jgi:histone-binding protein RBBP4
VQWLPDVKRHADHSTQRLLLGTHTSEGEQNYLVIAEVRVPGEDAEMDSRRYDEDKAEAGGFSQGHGRLSIVQKIVHDGEVNRARYSPTNPQLLATKTVSGDVHVFDYTKLQSFPKPEDREARPAAVLTGHTAEGYGLGWSPFVNGRVASGGNDNLICMWDLASGGAAGKKVAPTLQFAAHTDVVEDVAWHRHHEAIFGSVGDDRMLLIWDTRSPANPAHRCKAHNLEINSLSFNTFSEYVLLTASNDKTVALWDLRNINTRLHSFETHTDDVISVEWDPFHETVFAAASVDRRVTVWDVSRIGMEQTTEDAEDGPPELLFIHGGHTSKISDISWNPNDPWLLASVADDNILQIWQMAENIYHDDDNDDSNGPKDEDLE